MARKIYAINNRGEALLKTLVDPYSEFYIDAVLDLEDAMETEDMPHFEGTVFGAEHFDEIKQEQK
tara:strand:+ start:442 stop:636 length:195 start_codon:yes stop_codon:yes gene_type:complete